MWRCIEWMAGRGWWHWSHLKVILDNSEKAFWIIFNITSTCIHDLKFQYNYFRGTTAFQRHFDTYLKFGFALFGMIWTVNENWLPQVLLTNEDMATQKYKLYCKLYPLKTSEDHQIKGFDNFKVIPKDRQYMFTINKKLDFCVTQQCKRKVKLKIRDEKNYYEDILNRRM